MKLSTDVDTDPAEPLEPPARFRTHAYIVLASAFIEEFVEGCFEGFVEKALNASRNQVDGCFVSLATRFADDVLGQISTHPPAPEACPMLRGLYSSKIIRPNNGIKRRNLVALAKPLGLQERLETDCEGLLVPADTLGARRGRVAHIGQVVEEVRPAEARKLVTDVLDQLHHLLSLLELP